MRMTVLPLDTDRLGRSHGRPGAIVRASSCCLVGAVLGLLASAGGPSPAADSPSRVNYERDVRPVLAGACYKCHGPKKQEGGLRLDQRTAALRGGDSGPVLRPGKSANSPLIQRITAADEEVRMPRAGEPLDKVQVDLLRRWIDQGVEWPDAAAGAPAEHWSFRPVQDPPPPVQGTEWVHNPIDAFVLAKLEASGLHPSPPADRVALVRRLYLDLHGLPPTPDEVARFASDHRPDAWERLVDRVLANPRYGERWARHWLDLARFAETHGFERNLERPAAWPYRDYIIAALNEDRPYDRFVFEQLAGDTVGADAATGFLVAGPFDDVKSREVKFQMIQRQDELADMINAVGTAFLGLTLGCARCHSHKFDPISHKDYYALEAVLAGVQHGDRPLRGAEERRKARLTALEQRTAALERQLEPHLLRLREPVNPVQNTESFPPVRARFVRFTTLATSDGLEPALDELEIWTAGPSESDAMRMLARKEFTVPTAQSGEDEQLRQATLTVTCDDHCVVWLNGQRVAANDHWPVPVRVDVTKAVRRGRNVLAVECRDDKKPAGLLLRLSVLLPGGRRLHVVSDESWRQASSAPKGWETTDFDHANWSPTVSVGKYGSPPWGNVLAAVKPTDADKDAPAPHWIWSTSARNLALASTGAKATASGSLNDNPLRHQLAFVNDGRPGDAAAWVSDTPGRGWVQIELPEPALMERVVWGRDRTKNYDDRVPTEYRIEVASEPGKWQTVAGSDSRLPFGAEKNERLRYRFDNLTGDVRQRAEAQLAEFIALRAEQEAVQDTPATVYAGKFESPGSVRRLARGDPMQPKDVVGPDTVSVLGTLGLSADTPEPQRRVALAKWFTDPKNPLTARVMVNRIWQHHFGTGIVDTPSDFGTQGSRPTHPELLDWLAGRFVESGWSMKQIHRLILTSNTYRQSSRSNPHGQAADADSRLLWRYPPRRLEAEPIRDSILSVSGVLDMRMGGPGFSSFKPTQHHVRVYVPKDREGPAEWRRMVYMTKVRMEHDAVFGVFDDPDGGLVCPKRSRSTTTLQAFNLLNSEFMIQQSELFARRLRAEAGERPADQVRLAFRLALGREPDAAEAAAGEKLVASSGLSALCLALLNGNEFLFTP
jgi:hypothetical protein